MERQKRTISVPLIGAPDHPVTLKMVIIYVGISATDLFRSKPVCLPPLRELRGMCALYLEYLQIFLSFERPYSPRSLDH